MYVRSVRVLNLEKHQFSFQWLGILGVSPTHSFSARAEQKRGLEIGQSREKIYFHFKGFRKMQCEML